MRTQHIAIEGEAMRKEIVTGALILFLIFATIYFIPQRELSRSPHQKEPLPGIYKHDLELQKRIRITSGSEYAFGPAIWKNIVVWFDWRNMGNGPENGDIFGLDLTTGEEFTISTHLSNQKNPAIYENIVVWEDSRNGNWDIYGYDLETQKEFQITEDEADQINPAIWGNIVVWQDKRFGPWRIFTYDLSKKNEFPISQDYNTLSGVPKIFWNFQENPAIYDTIIVWTDEIVNGRTIVSAFDLSSRKEFLISDTDTYKTNPAIWENMIVWQDGGDIYGYNMETQTEFKITEDKYNQENPAIWGSIVVWEDSRKYLNITDIFGYDILDNREFQITDYYGAKGNPAIYGNIILWADYTRLIRWASSGPTGRVISSVFYFRCSFFSSCPTSHQGHSLS